MKRLIGFAVVFLVAYTFFWVKILIPARIRVSNQPTVSEVSAVDVPQTPPQVLGATITPLPSSFDISFVPRRQQFGLSCEFAAATSIIYHYTGLQEFSLANSLQAEKTLIEKVGVSNNPNLGIRMGETLPKDLDTLFTNLNQRFGGADYYGVHAPPFVDVFAAYNLSSKILEKENIEEIKQAIYNGHVVMTWIKIGYNAPIDAELSYGPVSIIRGEHAVVIHGYDATGFYIMDPGIGVNRHVNYDVLMAASRDFVAPFLEVYSQPKTQNSVDDVVRFGNATALPKSHLNIEVENASGTLGAGDQLAGILKDFGYSVKGIQTLQKSDESGVDIEIKQTDKDYLYVLTRDLEVANYAIASVSADLSASSSADAVLFLRD